jgi:hypothetical protein
LKLAIFFDRVHTIVTNRERFNNDFALLCLATDFGKLHGGLVNLYLVMEVAR